MEKITGEEINMLQFVEDCLTQWSDWNRDSCNRLGYPSHTIEHRLMREGLGAGMATGRPVLEMPGVVQRVESAIRQLPKRKQEVIKTKYLWVNMSDRSRARRLHMSYAHFRNVLDCIRWYLAGKLG